MDIGLAFAILGGSLAVALGGIGSAVGVGIAGEMAAGAQRGHPEREISAHGLHRVKLLSFQSRVLAAAVRLSKLPWAVH